MFWKVVVLSIWYIRGYKKKDENKESNPMENKKNKKKEKRKTYKPA